MNILDKEISDKNFKGISRVYTSPGTGSCVNRSEQLNRIITNVPVCNIIRLQILSVNRPNFITQEYINCELCNFLLINQ